jgi:NitT/TauT family transport system substrate-binding protein
MLPATVSVNLIALPARAHTRLSALCKQDITGIPTLLDGDDFRVRLDQTLRSALQAESRWAVREGLVDEPAMADDFALMRIEPLRALEARAMTVIK